MKRIGLNRTQLKIIAIISMVIDHIAWGFVDFYSPLGQILHVCGRLTVPIMCFFIAEGFKKTKDLKRYIYRMAAFAAISIIPFYLFFHEEYGYRQNIIFDLLLGLLLLTVLESKKLKKWAKVLLTIVIYAISATVGGWIITPLCFILAFYYGKTFKQKVLWFIISDVVTVLFLMGAITLNNIYHFSHYEWVWWDKTYLLGFMLALPLIRLYNGEKGKEPLGRYFFYIFYPAHFVVLWGIKLFTQDQVGKWTLYLGMHIIALVVILVITILSAFSQPSRGQSSVLLMAFGALFYTMGFILEILSDTVEGVHFACIVEYFGEYILMISIVFFIGVLCSKKVPAFVYVILTVISLVFMNMLIRTREDGFFYRVIDVNRDGIFSRPELVYGPGFFMSISYFTFISIISGVFCILSLKNRSPIQRKRLIYVVVALVFCWLPYFIKLLGWTGGYEIPALGIVCAAVCMYLCLKRYKFLDSVMVAGTNALDHSREGILVYDSLNYIQYMNKRVENVFDGLKVGDDMRKHELLNNIISEKTSTVVIDGKTYDFVIEPLKENEFVIGHMLWIIDNTEHYAKLEEVQDIAIRDALTGLYNRSKFMELVDKDLSAGKGGTLLMKDMDDFKRVNDENGHQIGDAVLIALADILRTLPEDIFYSGRLGGDEFCGFFRGEENHEKIATLLQEIMDRFENRIEMLGYEHVTSLSIGEVSSTNIKEPTFTEMYSSADKILYEAKMAGKRRFIIK